MKNINLKLSDNNYTVQAETNVNVDKNQDETLKELVRGIEGGLFTQGAAFLSIEGLMKKPVVLTITEYGDEM